MLNYKDYTGRVEFDEENGLFHGEVLGLKDVATFQGRSVVALEHAFRDSVDDCFGFCEERGEKPTSPKAKQLWTSGLLTAP